MKEINGNETLCLYYTADKEVDISKLKEVLKKSLPDYMIPEYLHLFCCILFLLHLY